MKIFTYSCAKLWVASLLVMVMSSATLAVGPSVPFHPTWQTRHHLQRLVDEAGLQITTTHWPLPLAAVQSAVDDLPKELSPSLDDSRAWVIQELRKVRWQGRAELQLREKSDAAVGYGENYTPGSSMKVVTGATEFGPGDFPIAAKLGLKIEQSPNSLQTTFDGWRQEGRVQARLDETAFVTEILGFNVQAFAHNHWWGPGWQSSLVNSNNVPAWQGLGIQRSDVKPSESKWLSWMGPWSLEFFVAQAQDPIVTANQPDGFLFIGSRLTLQPTTWLEFGLSRGAQTSGTGRPSGLNNFVKAFTSQGSHDVNNVNNDPGNQISGYDMRLKCPSRWNCAAYYQWIGEDSSGQSGLPNQFMTLAGAEQWLVQGRHRTFIEYTQTFTHSMPWNNSGYPKYPKGAGYNNSLYPQGYTNGGRWIGASFGGAARVLTVGWMDVKEQRVIKLHEGHIGQSLGSYDPDLANKPSNDFKSASIAQSFQWGEYAITPELMYTHLSQGQSVGANKKNDVRGGITISLPLGR